MWLAAQKAQRGKRSRPEVARFNLALKEELFELRDQLRQQSYLPGAYRQFAIYEPKLRLVSAAPYRNWVVHHAVCNVVEPILILPLSLTPMLAGREKELIWSLNASADKYLLKADILKYFPSTDHRILKSLFRRKIKGLKGWWLMDRVEDSGNPQPWVLSYFRGDDLVTPLQRRRGIPIGNLSSQFLANLYLNPMDHFIKEQLGARAYLRYCDDFAIFSNNKD